MIIIIWLASTLFQAGRYVQSAQEAQQLMTQMYVDDDEVLPDEPVGTVDVAVEEDGYDELLGDWFLTMAYLDGEYRYFDKESEFTEFLTFYDDRSVELFEYTDGELTLNHLMDVKYDDIYYSFVYDDTEVLPSSVAYEEYLVLYVYEDEMTVSLMFYDEDDTYLSSYTLYFEKI